MGTASSVCGSDNDIPEYSPAYLGQIYAGVVLNSAKSSSTGYASTLSLNSKYASSLSLNSLCESCKGTSSRKGSLAGTKVLITNPTFNTEIIGHNFNFGRRRCPSLFTKVVARFEPDILGYTIKSIYN